MNNNNPETSSVETSEAPYEPVNNAELFPEPTDIENRLAITRAKDEVKKPDFEWNGESSVYMIDGYNSCKGNSETRSADEIESSFKRFLVGFWGEKLLAIVPINEAKTIYAGENAKPENYLNKKIVDVASVTEYTKRNDLLICAAYLADLKRDETKLPSMVEEFNKERSTPISKETATGIVDLQRQVMRRYSKFTDSWKQAKEKEILEKNGDTQKAHEKIKHLLFPGHVEIVSWAVNQEAEDRGKHSRDAEGFFYGSDKQSTLEFSRFLAEKQNALMYNNGNPLDSRGLKKLNTLNTAEENYLENRERLLETKAYTPEKRSKIQSDISKSREVYLNEISRWGKDKESVYYDVSSPDGVIVDNKGHIAGSVEIKCYNPSEVERQVHTLEYTLDNEPSNKVHFGQEGLQAFVQKNPLKGDSVIMRMGFNPEGQSEFLRMVKKIRGEEISEAATQPTILRLLDDIPDELIIRLGDTMQRYGYKDFIIQKVGIDEYDVTNVARIMLKLERDQLFENMNEKDFVGQGIIKKLSVIENW